MNPANGSFINKRIPHRPPFLWVDAVLAIDADSIRAKKKFTENLDIFKGHYPDYPIVPGVILCESLFQTGALLITELIRQRQEDKKNASSGFVPVLTRISRAKFKQEVRPGDLVDLVVVLKEKVGPAWFLKGTARLHGKVAVQVEFACAEKKIAISNIDDLVKSTQA